MIWQVQFAKAQKRALLEKGESKETNTKILYQRKISNLL